MSTLKNAKSRRRQLYHSTETVMSPAGNSYVTEESVISPPRVFFLHTNKLGYEIKLRRFLANVKQRSEI